MKPQADSSSDIELPVLSSHALSFQLPPHEQASSSIPISHSNYTTHPTNVTDGIEPPTPAYLPPANDNPPIPPFDAGLLEYTRMHGHSEVPLSPRRQENDGTSVQANEAHADIAEPPPAYGGENPPVYSRRPAQHTLEEPTTWPMLCFKLGFVFPLLWIFGALTLVTPQGLLSRLCMPWFKDFAADSPDPWCHDDMQTEAEKEAYLAHIRAVEITWAKRCFFASSLLVCFAAAISVTLVAIAKVH